MRIGLLSDSHGNVRSALDACEKMGDVEEILHAGDFYRDAEDLSAITSLKVRGVVGNCDRFAKGEHEVICKIGSYKIFLTHGHEYGVKHGFDAIIKRAKILGVDVVVFGHTHIPAIFLDEDILFINPGSCSRPRGEGTASFGILVLQDEMLRGEIFDLKGQKKMYKCRMLRKQ